MNIFQTQTENGRTTFFKKFKFEWVFKILLKKKVSLAK